MPYTVSFWYNPKYTYVGTLFNGDPATCQLTTTWGDLVIDARSFDSENGTHQVGFTNINVHSIVQQSSTATLRFSYRCDDTGPLSYDADIVLDDVAIVPNSEIVC